MVGSFTIQTPGQGLHLITPQVAGALSGGAATISQGGVLGGFPHWNVGVRASVVQGSFPKIESVGFSTTAV